MTSHEELRSPVPPCGNIVRHHCDLVVVRFLQQSHQPKITQFSIALLIDQDVRRLEISVDNIGVMQKVQSLTDLVNDIFLMFFLKDVAADERMQIHIHMFEDKIDIDIVSRPQDLLQPNNIRMLQLLQKHNLAIDALRIRRV